MYHYIIDPQKIDQRSFERVQNQLYSCLSQLRISGEITRVTTLRSVAQLVESAISRGATTVVAVGHDSTVQEIVNAVGERDVTIGYVPLRDSELSRILGLTDVVNSCHSLAHRRVESLDLGQIQSNYFLTKVGLGVKLDALQPSSVFDFSKFNQASSLSAVPIKMEIDGQFSAEFEVVIGAIFNSRAARGEGKVANPTDGLLDVLLLPRLTSMNAWRYRNELGSGCLEKIPGCAVMHGKRITVSAPDGLPFYVGDKTLAKAPAIVEALPKRIRMIIGKDRTF
jgi:diacylglycerol kinase family enzyme